MQSVRIAPRNVRLPTGSTVVSVNYKIATTQLFDVDDIIYDVTETVTGEISKLFDLDFDVVDIYYTQLILTSNLGKVYTTRPMAITKDGNGFSYNNTVIVTPNITISSDNDNCELGNFKIKCADFVAYSGVDAHYTTTYTIKTITGKVVWEKKADKNNLTEIRVPSNTLESSTAYVIEVKFRGISKQYSNAGKRIIKTIGKAPEVELIASNSKLTQTKSYVELRDERDLYLDIIINHLALGNSIEGV